MVTSKRKQGLVAELTAGIHRLLSGLSEKLGGADEGPNPHQLLEASLAACTILTAQLYADRKGIKLESTDVIVKIISEGASTEIGLEVAYRGDLTLEQRQRLTEIIKKCPIHLLLESQVTIKTTTQFESL